MTHPERADLLALRDGAGSEAVAGHVAACPACAAELARLVEIRAALRGLPAARPERDLWPELGARIREERWRTTWLRTGIAAAGLFLTITMIAAVRGGIDAWHEAQASQEAETLVARSQQLEDALRVFERRVAVSGGEARAMLEIEDSIAVIDARLGELQRAGAEPMQTIDLWRERVGLLSTLVDLHANPPSYAGL